MEALLVSTGVVALAEMGDKTQLLSLLLASRFQRPIPILLGILVATLLNHACAGAVGMWVTHTLGDSVMRIVLAISFLAMAVWTLIPDKAPLADAKVSRLGIFGTTLVAFFLIEMGDKTQIATVALAAQYDAFYSVVSGTTIGMMLANVPAVMLGERATKIVPVRLIQKIAAALFVILAIVTLAT